MKPCINNIPISEFPQIINALGLKSYASNQIIAWLYKKRVTSFDEMTNLSKDARKILSLNYFIESLKIEKILTAKDKTKKFAFRLNDNNIIESVLIPADDGRVTLCISTQVGCAMGCVFCRTGDMKFVRDLTQGEIVGQVIEVQRNISAASGAKSDLSSTQTSETQITNIVLMGMGEPLANYDAVFNALQIMLDSRAIGLSKRRITLSTCGLLPELRKLTSQLDIKIAISLNATTDEIRSRIMPINRRYKISELMNFCREYSRQSRYRITFEYVLIRGVNDSLEDMKRLVKLFKGVRPKINLIPFNPFPKCELGAPLPSTLKRFHEFLIGHGIQTNIRVSRGQDILAACGQLASVARS